VISKVLTATNTKMDAFCVVAPCRPVQLYRRFGGAGYLKQMGLPNSKHLWNVGKLRPNCTLQQARWLPFLNAILCFLSSLLIPFDFLFSPISTCHSLSLLMVCNYLVAVSRDLFLIHDIPASVRRQSKTTRNLNHNRRARSFPNMSISYRLTNPLGNPGQRRNWWANSLCCTFTWPGGSGGSRHTALKCPRLTCRATKLRNGHHEPNDKTASNCLLHIDRTSHTSYLVRHRTPLFNRPFHTVLFTESWQHSLQSLCIHQTAVIWLSSAKGHAIANPLFPHLISLASWWLFISADRPLTLGDSLCTDRIWMKELWDADEMRGNVTTAENKYCHNRLIKQMPPPHYHLQNSSQ
jgi:hypothetical protein